MRVTPLLRAPAPMLPPLHDSETNRFVIPETRSAVLTLCISVMAALLFVCVPALARAQDYTSIVVFGDSLSDTGNVANLSEAKYGVRIPGIAANYADGLFTDGPYTLPAARNYLGVWIQQLAATLPARPAVTDSLDGGTDYAYGFATTGKGTSVLSFGPSNAYSVNVDNIGQQISDYLGTHPKITDKTLFVVWGGAIDLLYASSADQVFDAAIQESHNIQRLVDAGATHFLIPNLPPLGLTPRLNGSAATSVPATEASVLYNDVLTAGLAILRDFNFGRHLEIFQLDVFTLLEEIVAAPAQFDLANVTGMAQGNVAIDPDTWLFWDSLHPTTYGHYLLALAAERLIASPQHHDPFVKNDRGLVQLDPRHIDAIVQEGLAAAKP